MCGGSVLAFDGIRIEANLDDENRTITGVATYDFNLESAPDDIRFRLYSRMICQEEEEEGGTAVDSMFVNGTDVTSLLEQEGTDLYCLFPPDLRPEATFEVVAFFETVVCEVDNRFGYVDEQYRLETWFPMPAPRSDGRWRKVEYNLNAEPVADFYNFDVTLSYPCRFQLIAPGVGVVDSVGDTATARLTLDEGHECAMVLGEGFLIDTSYVGSTEILIFYQESTRPYLDTTRSLTQLTLGRMSELVCPYPYDELVVGMPAISGGALELPRMIWLPKRPYNILTVHEVIHQWFYGMINSDQAEDPWLDESCTEYFTERLVSEFRRDGTDHDISEYGLGLSNLALMRSQARYFMALYPITRAATAYDDLSYTEVVYHKGTLILKTMTGLMGDEDERLFWNDYATNYGLKRPTPEDFFATADKYLVGCETAAADIIGLTNDLDFELLSLSSEILEEDSDSTGEDQAVTYSSEITYSARYPLGAPVTLRVEFGDGSCRDTVLTPCSGIHTVLIEKTDQPVVGAILDPDYVYAVDVNLLNNSLITGSNGAGLRLFSGLTFLVELLIGLAWGL